MEEKVVEGMGMTRGRGAQVKECGADAKSADEDGKTAVMWLAEDGCTETVVELVRVVVERECCGWRSVGIMATVSGCMLLCCCNVMNEG